MATNGSSEILPAIPAAISLTTGPLILGILLNWGCMGVLVAQIYYYHFSFLSDSKAIKCLVYGLGALDTVQTVMFTADIFHWFVFGFGNVNQLDESFVNAWDVPFFDAIISLIVQVFYCWRIYILRNNSLVFPAIILAISLMQCGAGMATGVIAHNLGKLSLISTEVIERTIWLVGSVIADTMITVVLIWTLLRSRSSELQASNSMLRRIVRLTVETNSLTAGVAMISLILFFAFPQHSTFVVTPSSIIGKLYTNCLVAVLNNRELNRHLNRTHNLGEISEFSARNGRASIVRLGKTDDSSGEAQVKVSVIVDTATDYIELGDKTNQQESSARSSRLSKASV